MNSILRLHHVLTSIDNDAGQLPIDDAGLTAKIASVSTGHSLYDSTGFRSTVAAVSTGHSLYDSSGFDCRIGSFIVSPMMYDPAAASSMVAGAQEAYYLVDGDYNPGCPVSGRVSGLVFDNCLINTGIGVGSSDVIEVTAMPLVRNESYKERHLIWRAFHRDAYGRDEDYCTVLTRCGDVPCFQKVQYYGSAVFQFDYGKVLKYRISYGGFEIFDADNGSLLFSASPSHSYGWKGEQRLTLGGSYDYSTPGNYTYAVVYGMRVYRGDETRLELVPCRQGGVLGMYDTVSGKLLENIGAGEFSAVELQEG